MMAKSIGVVTAAAFAAIVLGTGPATAGSKATPTAGDKCESGKNYVSGSYMNCVGKAEKKLILTGDSNAYSLALGKCVSKFDILWGRYEAAAAAQGATCPSEDDGPDIKGFLDSCSQSVGEALAGGSLPDTAACQSDLTACQDDLTTTQADLDTCATDLGVCDADLGTCTADLASAQGSLSSCGESLGACSTAYSECNASMGTCASDLGTCTGDLGTCTGNLGVCSADLSVAQSGLDACTGDLGTCTTGLSSCTGDLGTCNTDLSTCTGDLATCESQLGLSKPLKTGQTLCYTSAGATTACAGTGQDGEVRAGAALSYTDNGNGTITDATTGLMWEKLSDDGSVLHDADNTYNWDAAFTKIAALNTAVFAGHNDWRLPNRAELASLSVANLDHPATPAAFNSASCAPGCTITTCSCTRSNFYWTSTTYNPSTPMAWVVGFATGNTNSYAKTTPYYVRAVRGGL